MSRPILRPPVILTDEDTTTPMRPAPSAGTGIPKILSHRGNGATGGWREDMYLYKNTSLTNGTE